MAPLELIMVLPVILGFLIAIMWLGVAMNTQAVVIVQARHDAWNKRYDGAAADALRFDRTQGVEGQAAQKIQFMQRFDGIASASSRHMVLGGAWDYRQLPLNDQPNWKVYARLVVNGASDALQSALDLVTGLFGNLTDVGSLISKELGSLLGIQQQIQSSKSSYQERANQEVQKDKAQLETLIDQLQTKIDGLNSTINRDQAAVGDKQKQLDQNKEKLQDPKLPKADKDKLEAENKQLSGEIQSLNAALKKNRSDRDAALKKQQAVKKLISS